jgi:hypothetical protein
MLAKWIVAEIPESGRYSMSQEKRTKLIDNDGFLVQCEGLIESSSALSGNLSFWRDWSSYEQAARSEIEESSETKPDFCKDTQVVVANVIMKINESDPRILALEAEFLRVSDASLHPDCSPIFIARQMQTWNPALQAAQGMMGALICRVDGNHDRYLNASFWRDRQSIDAFEQTRPALTKETGLEDYVDRLVAYHIRLEPAQVVVKR